MSGMEPMLIGAAIGGGISAARGGNPITGALLGGITGGIGSGIMGAATTAASNAVTTGLTTGGGVLAPTVGSSLGAGGSAIGSATGLTAPAMTGLGLTPASTGLMASQAALKAPAAFSGVGLTSAAAPTFMQTMREVPGVLGDYLKQNPMNSLRTAQTAQETLFPEQPPMPMAPSAGLMRGTQIQQQNAPYAMARPQISLI